MDILVLEQQHRVIYYKLVDISDFADVSDYTIIGTIDVNNNTTNTKIFLNGNTCTTAGYQGGIQYWASSTGGHAFYTASGEKMRINDAGGTTFNGPLYISQNDSYPDLR